MEDEEEVVRELDVYVTNDLDLYLLQLPLKPCYGDAPEIYSARFKPHHKILELSGDQTVPKLASSTISKSTRLAVAVIRNNEMHLTPINQVLQLRPSFGSNQHQRTETVEMMSEEEGEEEVKDKGSLEQVQMRRRETDKSQSQRKKSYTYKKAMEESEPWKKLTVHQIGSQESEVLFEHMYLDDQLRSRKCFNQS